jgi:hypothetical protein
MPRSKLQAQPMPLLGLVQSWQLRKAAHEGQHVPLLTRDTGHRSCSECVSDRNEEEEGVGKLVLQTDLKMERHVPVDWHQPHWPSAEQLPHDV